MVLIKRKAVEMIPAPDPGQMGDDVEAYYLTLSGEIFLDYESYASRLSFFNQRRFQCELSGRQGLTYLEALQSEEKEAKELHRRFPQALKGPLLRAAQFVVAGRLDNLVDKAYDRFANRFFEQETVQVERSGTRELSEDERHGEGSSHAHRMKDVTHVYGTDLNKDEAEANQIDDPADYLYHVRFLDDEDSFVGSLTEVRDQHLTRDRRHFSKVILKKYLKECLERDAAIGSPWTVRVPIAQQFGIPLLPSEAVQDMHRLIREQQLSKRRKLETKDEETAPAPAKKRNRKVGASAAENAAAAAAAAEAAEAARREEEEKRLAAERRRNIKYPIEDLQVDPITHRELMSKGRDEQVARRRDRPVPSRDLSVPHTMIEPLLNTYFFLQACGKPLMLSPFSLDDYEAALRHATNEPPCVLISEIHAALINVVVRDGPHSKDLAPAQLAAKRASSSAAKNNKKSAAKSTAPANEEEDEEEDELEDDDEDGDTEDDAEDESDEAASDGDASGENGVNGSRFSESETTLLASARSFGAGWEKRLLKAEEDREGWERSLVGALYKRATSQSLPRLLAILSQLTGVEHPDAVDVDGAFIAETFPNVEQRYPHLPMSDKLAAISFLCELAVMTRPVRGFYDECEATLTELRKERIDVSRARKKLAEDRAAFEEAHKKEEGAGEQPANGLATKADPNGMEVDAAQKSDSSSEKDELDSSNGDVEEVAESEASDVDISTKAQRLPSRQEALRARALERAAQERKRAADQAAAREAHRAKTQEAKQLASERNKLIEEEIRLDKQEDFIDREFRRWALAPRLMPLGRDRFFDRYWWFDGIGSASLVTSHGAVNYSTGRLFVQGASDEEWSLASLEYERGPALLMKRREEEQGAEGVLAPNEWAVYTSADDVEELISWLRAKGHREGALRQQITKFRSYIGPGIAKRNHDLAGGWRENFVETRRSGRAKVEQSHMARQPYMLYKNTLAKN
ncbi:Chromatin remodeling complex WSTF-ISWI, large subunit (contains heterochromatin localization, PHD and BROMO domains) [Ceraceosorus bombacis]|uniref:Chromatin remodeling complex WSTF-ISWI, large subunit (Contains heterochromatin localization, PHD and BROMO domains) n=1 Tax=Ceraceosorus bombacis TaxID=401625 RepID=A0A0P1BRQ6_9BASI|nr:Chromatin remodeling complex WSTF-ISWI, large subunit (contains heterochromatin localization, PHD and BROMO domains) [Ceraceosorus bombacis]